MSAQDLSSKQAIMPDALTAENGAKVALWGEFNETLIINCPYCNDGEDIDYTDDECDECGGSQEYLQRVPVTWTTIKEIYAKAVEHFKANPIEQAPKWKEQLKALNSRGDMGFFANNIFVSWSNTYQKWFCYDEESGDEYEMRDTIEEAVQLAYSAIVEGVS